MDRRLRRMTMEITDCENDKSLDIKIELIDQSPFHLKGSFPGPQDTPYEGGYFEVDIVIPSDYPLKPSQMKFITKVYHPNISSTSGAISLNILGKEWSPALTLRTTLISLQVLLSSPKPDDPQDAEVAKHYTTSKQGFDETARYWTHLYAGGPAVKEMEIQESQKDEVAIAGY